MEILACIAMRLTGFDQVSQEWRSSYKARDGRQQEAVQASE